MSLKYLILFVLCSSLCTALNAQVVVPNVWINEIHYDNTGTDTLEGYEIAGPAGTNLACYEVFLYNGSSGTVYATDTLTGTISNQQNGYGTVWFALPANGFQNINGGGLALVYAPQATGCGEANQDTVVQFISYGGSFVALNGRVQGMASTDIGELENSSTPVGYSLQLGGTGVNYSDFSWQPPLPNTYGLPNAHQNFIAPIVNFIGATDTFTEKVENIPVFISISNPNAGPTSVDINVIPGGTGHYGSNFTYAPTTVVFPPNSQTNQLITITTIDDSIADSDKSFTFILTNTTNNAIVGPDSEFVFYLRNDDTTRLSIQQTDTVDKSVGAVNVPVSLDIENIDTVSAQLVVVPNLTTAVLGVDYSFNDTSVTWLPLTRGTINVPVTVINNSLHETSKTLTLQLINPTNGAILSDSIFQLTIIENDSIYFRFLKLSDTVSQTAGTIPVVVEVDNPTNTHGVFSIFAESSSTAMENIDYYYISSFISDSGFVSFDTIYIDVLQNALISPTKKLILYFANLPAHAAIIPDSTFTLYITNNNVLSVSFLGAAYSYPKDTPPVQVKVVLSTYSQQPITANVTLAPGSAVYGVDYLFDDTTVVFSAYSNDTQGVWVTLINNNLYQGNEQINFNLTNPVGGAILGITGFTLTIIENDSLAQGIPLIDLDNNVKVFPNPATNLLNIQAENILNRVEVHDMLGKVIISTDNLIVGKNELDISALPAGMYFLSVIANDKVYSKPFIKAE